MGTLVNPAIVDYLLPITGGVKQSSDCRFPMPLTTSITINGSLAIIVSFLTSERQAGRLTEKQRQADRHARLQTGTMYSQADRQADRKAGRKQAYRQEERQVYSWTHMHTDR
jgi:hypothetical protein